MAQTILVSLVQALENLFDIVKKFVITVINGIIQFARDIVGWFRQLVLDPKKQTPFIVESQRLKELIKNAPVVHCGIFEGVYNEETNTIEHYREISADGLDSQTQKVLSNAPDNNPIVVLN